MENINLKYFDYMKSIKELIAAFIIILFYQRLNSCFLFSCFVFIDWLNTFHVHNREILIDALDNRPKGTPLITVCNHHSCLDDPLLWG